MKIFNEHEIENTMPNGDSRIQIKTKREPKEEWLQTAYEAKGYEELLLDTATAINLNHTSLKVAEWLCEAIPSEFWNDKNLYKKKILNPFGDSGFTEKYIITKLMRNEYMKKKFPDYGQRAYHILHNMIFSVSKTHAASYWQRKIVYGSSDGTITGDNSHINGEEYPAFFHGRLFSVGYDKDKLISYHKYGNIKSPYVEGVIGKNSIFNYPMLDWIKSKRDIKEYFAIVFWDLFCDEEYTKIDETRRNKIMEEIKNKLDGYFDVIIGNPPYNTNDEKTGAVGETVYNYFCLAADQLHPKYESFIIPSKWAYGKARMPEEFSQSILTGKNVSYLKLIDGHEAFPSVDTGEISIYSKDNTKICTEFIFNNYGKIHKLKDIGDVTYEIKGKRWLKPIDTIVIKIQSKIQRSIADDSSEIVIKTGIKYNKHKNDLIENAVCFKYDYEKLVETSDGRMIKRPTEEYSLLKTDKFSTKFYMPCVKLWKKNKSGDFEKPVFDNDKMMPHIFIDGNIITDWKNNKFEHEVLVTTTINHYYKLLLDYPYNAFIMKPGETTEGQIAICRSLKTRVEVENLQKFIRTKFVTYLITINQVSQHFTSEALRFVPYMDFTQEWDDDKLNKYFELDDEEIKRINDLWGEFRPMRRAQLAKLDEEMSETEDEENEE